MEDEELLARAAEGDRDAAGAFLGSMLPGLLPAARRIAGSSLDPEDLLAEAVLGLLAQWQKGAGPRDSAQLPTAVDA